uniref:Uncharacterized protein n=1 Tax=Lygus hesperus TaxID=30085 RepID=A0A146MBH5_LYGHE
MPPVRFTIESFEDVTGYPGKVFYVLHQYPGTGCPQVPFLAIDKNDEGGFTFRELDPSPVEYFDDEKYKFRWPRDPRLQATNSEAEEVVKSEISSPSAEGIQPVPVAQAERTEPMPIVQDVKSVSMDVFQKIIQRTQQVPVVQVERSEPVPIVKDEEPIGMDVLPKTIHTQGHAAKSDSSERGGTPVDIPGVKEVPKAIVQKDSLPLSSKVKEFSVSASTVVNIDASNSFPVSKGGRMSSENKTSKSVETKVDGATNRSNNALVNSESSSSEAPLAAEDDDGMASSKKTEKMVPLDSKVVELPTQISSTLINQHASTSKTSSLVVGNGGVASEETRCEVQAEYRFRYLPKQNNSTFVTQKLTCDSKTPKPGEDKCVEESKKTGGGGVCDESRKSKSTAILKTSASSLTVSKSTIEGSKSKTEGTASGSHKECARSPVLTSCSNDSTDPSLDHTVEELLSSAKSNVELKTPASEVTQKTQLDTVSRDDKGAKSLVETSSCNSRLYSSSDKPSQPKTIPDKTLLKEISTSMVTTSSLLAKSGNQPNESTVKSIVTDSDSSNLETPSAPQKTIEPITVTKDISVAKLGKKDSTPEKVSGIISGNKKSDESRAYKDDPKKSRELTDRRAKDQAVHSKTDTCTSKKNKETSCLPRTGQKDVSIVEDYISRAKNFVEQKRIQISEQYEKSVKGNSTEPRCRVKEGESRDKVRKSKSIERVDDQKIEKARKKSITSTPKPDDFGDKTTKDVDNVLIPSKASEPSFVPSSTVYRVRLENSVTVVKSSTPIDSGSGVDVYQFESDSEALKCKKGMKKRRNTVDGSEDTVKARTKRLSSKFLPYNLQKYRKDLEKYRPTKKIPSKTNSLEAQNSVQIPNADGGSSGSKSCPGSPVSKNMKSSLEDIFNLQAILTDESSVCNYSDITLKGPVQVASNASLDRPLSPPLETHNLKPSLKDKASEKTEEKRVSNTPNKAKLDSAKAGQVEQNDGSLSNFAEAASSKTPKHDSEEHKKKERRSKCLALFKEQKLATEAANVEVDKGGASNKHDTLEVGGGSNYCPPTIGMHKLPAIVSSQRTKIKPIIRKPIISKNNTVGETKNINEPSDKESIVEEKLNTKAVVKSRESQVGKEDEVDNQQLQSSQFTKSPKVQLALKRQKRLESPSSTFPEAPNIDNTEPSNDRDPGRKDIKKLSKDSSKPKASRKDSTDNVSPVDKASAVGLDTPETSVSADVTPASSSTVAVPKVSSLRFEFASELTEPLPTTETRKQLLRQLNSEITEKKVPTPPNPAQEGVLVPLCIGSDDLIQDKIMNVVEGIVKVKVEMIESVKKKDSSSKLPTAGELDEYFLEIFGNDTPPIEKDDPSARGSTDKSDLEKSLTASDTQACSSNFVVSDTKTVDTGLNEKSESNVQAPQDLNYESGRNAHHGSQEKTDSPTINTSASNGLLRTPVNQSKTGSNNSGASYDVAEVSNESTALGDREPAAVSPAVGSVTPGKTETDKSNTGINTEKEVPDVEDDTFVISSQESDVEVVDVGSSSQKMPQPLPVEMPRPIVSLNCRPMDDDVVVIEPATPGQSCSLNAGSKSNDALQGSTTKRPLDDGSEQPKRKRLCAIPAPKLLPISAPSPRPVSSKPDFHPTLEPPMPLPMLEPQNSITTPKTPTPPTEAPIEQDNEPDESQSSTELPSSTSKTTNNISEQLQIFNQYAGCKRRKRRARLGAFVHDDDDAGSPLVSSDSTVNRRISVIPLEDCREPTQTCSDLRYKKKRRRKAGRKHKSCHSNIGSNGTWADGTSSTSGSKDGMKTHHEEPSAQSIGSSTDTSQGDVQEIPSSSGGAKERSPSEDNSAGPLTAQKSIPRGESISIVEGRETQSLRKPRTPPKRKRQLLNIIRTKAEAAAWNKQSSSQGRESSFSHFTQRGSDPQEASQRRWLLSTPPNYLESPESGSRRELDDRRILGQRDIFSGRHHSDSTKLQEAPLSKIYNDALIDWRRTPLGVATYDFEHVRPTSKHAEMAAAQYREDFQSRSRRSSLEESYGRRAPLLGEAPQEVLACRADRFKRPPLLEGPPRQTAYRREQGSRIPSIFEVDHPRRAYDEFEQDIEICETPFGRRLRKARPERASTSTERISSREVNWAWSSEGQPEESRRWTPPSTSQHRPQESQRPHQERRLLTSRRSDDYNPHF